MDGLKGSALVSPTQFAGLTLDWIQICSKYNIKSPPQKKITLNAKVVIFAQEKRKMAIAKNGQPRHWLAEEWYDYQDVPESRARVKMRIERFSCDSTELKPHMGLK